MKLTEETLTSQIMFSGRVIQTELDTALLPNGSVASREVVRHPGGVAVLPLHDDGTVTLVRQFRYPFGAVLLEAPAGKLDPGEDPGPASRRELSEETGFTARTFTDLGAILPSPGFCDEVIHLYLATGLTAGASHPDEDEFVDTVRMPLDELVEQVMSGAVTDAKTVALALKTQRLLEK